MNILLWILKILLAFNAYGRCVLRPFQEEKQA